MDSEKKSKNTTTKIGGSVCSSELPAGLIFAEGQDLTDQNKEALWKIFAAIGKTWGNTVFNSNNQRSSWYEMLKAKTENPPNYAGEYVNAIYVMEELYEMYGEEEAFRLLFFESNIDSKIPPVTRLEHCKIYVVNEFIKMQVVAGGFKYWGPEPKDKVGKNYAGYIGGSRFNERSVVRDYNPEPNK